MTIARIKELLSEAEKAVTTHIVLDRREAEAVIAENERLREALQVFAPLWENRSVEHGPLNSTVHEYRGEVEGDAPREQLPVVQFTRGELRFARAALKETGHDG